MVSSWTASSDLGRRAAHRRGELGLTTAQVACRARMTPGYLDYLENHSANVSPEALRRLARALEVSPTYLLGGHAEVPPGSGVRCRVPVLEKLSEDECRRLIAPGGVGRVVFLAKDGPVAVPVNYAVLEGVIVFRTMGGGELDELSNEDVGFQVDRLDEAFNEGWNVVISGRARRIDDPREIWRLHGLVEHWAGDDRRACVRIKPHGITGRRIRTD